METFICAGYSGHAWVVVDALRASGNRVLGYFEQEAKEENPHGLDYLGDEREEEILEKYGNGNYAAALGTGENRLREKLFHRLRNGGYHLPPVSDPTASFSGEAEIGDGTFLSRGCKVNCGARVGHGAILNTGCVVEHGCRVEDFVHVAPGAVLLGEVYVGERALVGANAVVKQGIRIGSGAMIGAGSVVLEDVPAGSTIAGNPARSIS